LKRIIALILVLITILSFNMLPVTAQSTVVDVCFRNMETSQSDLNTSRCTYALSQKTYTQGSHSVEYTIADDAASGLLLWYFYTEGQSGSINIAGATHLQFDLYVPTDGYFDNITGDARVQIDDADHKNAWGTSGGTASAASVKAALKGLKSGWNHVSIPLDSPSNCTNAVDLRIYMGGSGAKSGDKLYLDDLRFVNDAANTTITPLRNSAKEVIALVSQGEYAKAANTYSCLSNDAKAYVPKTMVENYGLQSLTSATLYVPVMSFNIRQSEGGDSGMNHWNNRKEAVYSYLNNSGTHVMCLQEVKRSQSVEIIAAISSKYTAVYYERDQSTNPEGLMIIYDNTLYDLVEKQVFWLSETPDVMSKGWGANYYRICVVVMLKHKQTGKLLNVFNVHLDHQVTAAQVGGMNLVLQRLSKRMGHSVVMGDFNVTDDTDAYKAIAAKMKDCRVAAPVSDSGFTYNGWGSVTSGSPIDFIFVNKEDTAPETFTICRDKWGDGYYYSDHYAVRSNVTFTYLSDDQKIANKVIDQIGALSVNSLEDKPAVVAIREIYNALTDTQKDYVTNLEKLVDAETKIAELEKAAVVYGDVDGDGVIAAVDALETLKAAVDKIVLTDEQVVVADVDGNGKVDTADALTILQKVVGKIEKFPIEK